MSKPVTDRNLLFGAIAVQLKLISRDELSAALPDWSQDRSRPLDQVLIERQALTAESAAVVNNVLRQHLDLQREQAAPPDASCETLPPMALARTSGFLDASGETVPPTRPPTANVSAAPDDGVTLPPPRMLAAEPSAAIGAGSPEAIGETLPPPSRPPALVPANLRDAGDTHRRGPAGATHGPGAAVAGGTMPALRGLVVGPTIPGYQLLGELGRGGMGVVYKAQDVKLHRLVALKMILSGAYAEEADLVRFRLEAEAVAKLQHPNIVQVFEINECDGRPYFSLEFVDGGPLDKKLGGNPLPPRQAAELLEQLARAMHYAHQRDILHRDLKPANVLLTSDGTPKITDFGLAKKLDDKENSKTQGGTIMGTPSYMAPEQALGADAIGPAADIHSLGAILYEFLTGRPPFKGATVLDTLEQVRNQEPVPPSRLQPKVPKDLETIGLKCLQKNVAKRYATAGELADDVKRFLDGEPIQARPTSAWERAWKWARRRPGAAAAILVSVLALTLVVVGSIGANIMLTRERAKTEEAQRERALAQVEALLDASPQAVPGILQGLEHFPEWVAPRLQELLEQPDLSEPRRTRVSLALLAGDPEQVEYLRKRLLDAEPAEMILLRDSLLPYKEQLTAELWATARDTKASTDRRYRAIVVLAAFDPQNDTWKSLGELTVARFLDANPLHLGAWTTALRPARQALLPALVKVCRDPRQGEKRQLAATILADYAADQPEVLVDLLLDADQRQFPTLFSKVQQYREQSLTLLNKELDRTISPEWNDPPLNPAWTVPDSAVVAQIEAADGLVGERFALCQTMPLEQFLIVAEALRKTGYRPKNFRPYNAGKAVQVAAVWLRDGRDWGLVHGIPAEEMKKHDEEWRGKKLVPFDVAAYAGTDGRACYAALWLNPIGTTKDTRLYVGARVGGEDVAAWEPLIKNDFYPQTYAPFVSGKQLLYSSVWVKLTGPRPGFTTFRVKSQTDYEANLNPGNWQVDVRLSRPGAPVHDRERFKEQLAQVEAELKAKPNDRFVLHRRAQVLYRLGEHKKALADLDLVIAKYTALITIDPAVRIPPDVFRDRALVNARLAKVTEARRDLAEYEQRSTDDFYRAYIALIVSADLGEQDDPAPRLEAELRKHAGNSLLVYNTACGYARASEAAKDAARGKQYADRAIALLGEALARGYRFERLLTDADLDSLRQRPDFQALLVSHQVDPQYSGVLHTSSTRVSQDVHGLPCGPHLQRCRELAAEGWRPASVSVTETEDGKPLLAASVWHRPIVRSSEKDRLARRQGQAAITLLRLGAGERLWPLLQHTSEPRVRSVLINELGLRGADSKAIVRRLEQEKDVSIRRALMLCLGEFPKDSLAGDERGPLADKWLTVYRNDPDPGIHAAAEWLLRQHGDRDADLRKIDAELAGQPPGERRWYVSKPGETFTVVPGPVEFFMGSPGGEFGRTMDERLHRRRINRSFAIATKGVTVEQFAAFRADVEKKHPGLIHHYSIENHSPEPNGPIINVTWFEAAAYCRWLSEQEGVADDQMCYPPIPQIKEGMRMPADYLKRSGYRLPTEAEWEFASRAGATSARHFGDDEELLGRYAWWQRNASNRAWPVGRLKPNELGLFDILGNTYDWCQDRYAPYIAAMDGTPTEDREDTGEITDTQERVMRGGSFEAPARWSRCACRAHHKPSERRIWAGLRVVRTRPGAAPEQPKP